MLQLASSFVVGFWAKASCDLAPRVSWRGRSFKLSFSIQSASLPSTDGSGQRPFVTISAGDRTKKTEVGTWNKERGEWLFREVITLEVTPDEEVTVTVSRAQQYDLVVAAVELASDLVGEVCFPVASALPRLKAEDRDLDGLMFVTDVIGFDLLSKGAKTGRVYISMETKSPPSQRISDKSSSGTARICCGGDDKENDGFQSYHEESYQLQSDRVRGKWD
jgi:hypothetical protein